MTEMGMIGLKARAGWLDGILGVARAVFAPTAPPPGRARVEALAEEVALNAEMIEASWSRVREHFFKFGMPTHEIRDLLAHQDAILTNLDQLQAMLAEHRASALVANKVGHFAARLRSESAPFRAVTMMAAPTFDPEQLRQALAGPKRSATECALDLRRHAPERTHRR